jgi:hypothetical protein
MQLIADFVADWIQLLKKIMTDHWGYDISSVQEEEIPFLYFNSEFRRISKKKRIVKISNEFQCPSHLSDGWDLLKSKFENGEDVESHQSKLLDELNSKDSMLNDWNIYHFHLGTRMEGNYINRTRPLLFAMIDNDNVYAVNIFDHGQWANSDIVDIIHNNWPEVIKEYKIKNFINVSGSPEEAERINLRKKNINTFFTVSDDTVYSMIGGGVVSSGYNIQAIIKTDRQKAFLKNLEKYLEFHLPNLKKSLIKHGYRGEDKIKAELIILEDEYIAKFPEYNIIISLMKKQQLH